MNWDEIYEVVTRWFRSGLLPQSDKPLVQAAYTELTGDTGERCRTCESYWSDVRHTLRYHLIKVLHYESMDLNNKYKISEEAGIFQVHGESFVYVTAGSVPESETAKWLTDETAERLLKENPDRKEVILKNPDYKEPKKEAPKETKDTKPTAPKAPAKQSDKSTKQTPAAPVTPPVPTTDPVPPIVPVTPPGTTTPAEPIVPTQPVVPTIPNEGVVESTTPATVETVNPAATTPATPATQADPNASQDVTTNS